MEKLSGLVLDVYDDRASGGEVLRTIFPTEGALPDLVKEAHDITAEERAALPDDAFAVVLMDSGVELKKFATIDAGNTALSVEYFLKTGHKLPLEAQKLAAANLCRACGWHGIEPPEKLKEASMLGLALGASMLPGTLKEVKGNMAAAKTSPGQIMTPQQIQHRRMQMGA